MLSLIYYLLWVKHSNLYLKDFKSKLSWCGVVNSMSKYFWEVNVRSDENKLSYIPVLDGHPSLGPTTCLLLLFFLHTGHIAPPKMPFQNKLCCWSSLSWDSLLKNSSLSPDELISRVASKGGTTEKALLKLDEHDTDGAILDAMLACTRRADELGSISK